MPTNLPDPRKRKAQASEEPLLYVMIAVMVVGMIIALAIVGWSVAIAGWRSRMLEGYQSRRRAISRLRWFSGTSYSSIAFAIADSGPSRTVVPAHHGQHSGDCGQFLMSV
jgi:hypothetical protein